MLTDNGPDAIRRAAAMEACFARRPTVAEGLRLMSEPAVYLLHFGRPLAHARLNWASPWMAMCSAAYRSHAVCPPLIGASRPIAFGLPE